MNSPLVTVIVTTYNRYELLDRCLKSLKSQNYENFEVFIYDDGSSDQTKEIFEDSDCAWNNEFVRFTYIWKENWGGPAKGRNEGLKWAQGEWCSFLDSDDWWNPQRLSELSKYFVNNDVIYHKLQFYNKNGPMKKTTNDRTLTTSVFKELLIKGNCLSNSATIFKKELAFRVGGVSEERHFQAVEDYELWLKMASHTDKFYFLNKILGYYWIGDDNISQASEAYVKNITHLVNHYVKELNPDESAQALIYLEYIIARNLQAMEKTEAKEKFRHVFLHSDYFMLKLKALYCYLKMSF
jgi:glycosyltransferase involved in cell wall biosynthesis